MEPNGLLCLLKPPGLSSHDVVGAVRRALGTRRVGHAGTLDPAAAGVMAVAVGKATRALGYLQDDKRYRAEALLGVATDTLDAEGALTARTDASGVTRAALEAARAAFAGRVRQRPPLTSAVQVGGKRLYAYAHRGEALPEEAIPEREVTIHALEIVDFAPGETARLRFDVHCSAGTYVRTLAADWAAAVGHGAHLSFLLRTASGRLALPAAQTLEELAASGPAWVSWDEALPHLEAVSGTPEIREALAYGRAFAVPAAAAPAPPAAPGGLSGALPAEAPAADTLRVMGPDGALWAIARRVGPGRATPTVVMLETPS